MSSDQPIPKTQTAAVIQEFRRPYVLSSEHPVKQASELAPNQCLVKIEYAGVCHSDLHIRNADWAVVQPKPPFVGGHEGVGTVVAIGAHSSDHVQLGDRVGLKWIGNVSYVNYVTPIPEGLDGAAAAPILCAGLTVYKALKQANIIVSQWVAIGGAGGGLGHLAVQYAVAMGFRVLAIDTGEAKKKLTLGLGAEKWIDFKETTNLIQDVKEATGGAGPDAAIIAAGDAKPFNDALLYLNFKGTLVCVGMPGGAAMLNAPVPLLIAKDPRLGIISLPDFSAKCVINCRLNTRRSQQDMTEALRIAALGKVKCQHQVKPLAEINQVMDDLEKGSVVGRIVLKVS
ncbi:hypothetical protein CVT24_009263 [Panaeolus cyanescens]|uniref:alcohol dehydrogenase n=1 Tax=Panaeolus cyanescens TaxID=181874 RepID=A0A409Y7V4_9AGAR|nr:hypothetical protein CVT24_009263 [Panaeolus cyanescens]